eukprot:6033045-Prymnesium_polylepis.2
MQLLCRERRQRLAPLRARSLCSVPSGGRLGRARSGSSGCARSGGRLGRARSAAATTTTAAALATLPRPTALLLLPSVPRAAHVALVIISLRVGAKRALK